MATNISLTRKTPRNDNARLQQDEGLCCRAGAPDSFSRGRPPSMSPDELSLIPRPIMKEVTVVPGAGSIVWWDPQKEQWRRVCEMPADVKRAR